MVTFALGLGLFQKCLSCDLGIRLHGGEVGASLGWHRDYTGLAPGKKTHLYPHPKDRDLGSKQVYLLAELPSHHSRLHSVLLAQQCGSGKEGAILKGFGFGTASQFWVFPLFSLQALASAADQAFFHQASAHFVICLPLS